VRLGDSFEFTGVSNGLPVFKGNGRLYRLEGGALVELDFVKGHVERASVYDIVVVDDGRLLRAYDPSGKIFLELPKEPEVNCYATRYGVLCYRSGLCGLIEPGVSTINIEASSNEGHELRIASDVPVLLSYGDKQLYCRPGEPLVIREEKASVWKRLVFEAGVTHLLSNESVTVASPPAKVSVEAYAHDKLLLKLTSRTTVDFKKLMSPGNITIFSVPKADLGENLARLNASTICHEVLV
jgi:hypothetical protein